MGGDNGDYAPLAFVDTETTGLDPDRHQIWEVGAIIDGEEWLWHLPVDLGRAESIALKIGQFHERWGNEKAVRDAPCSPLVSFAEEFAELTRGRHLVGAVISFDEERLRRLLRANGACPEWHYHLVDVEALAAGRMGVVPPWNSDELSRAVGVDPELFDRHTALGDARWAKAIYDEVMTATGGSPEAEQDDTKCRWWFDENAPRPEFPWRIKCPRCGWVDTFRDEEEARQWAWRHDMHQ